MFLDIQEMTELARRRFDVEVPARAGYGDNKRRAEDKLIKKIAEDMGIETHHGDFQFSDKRIIDAETEKVPRLLMVGRWWPPITTAHLRGGSKDGRVLALPSPRFDIEFRVKKFNREEFTTGGAVETEWETYALSGWDTTARQHIYYLTEDMESHLRDYSKLLNVTL